MTLNPARIVCDNCDKSEDTVEDHEKEGWPEWDLPPGWIRVTQDTAESTNEYHFDSIKCLVGTFDGKAVAKAE
jgi:hypothetical protein